MHITENFTAAHLLRLTDVNEKTLSLGTKGRYKITEEGSAFD